MGFHAKAQKAAAPKKAGKVASADINVEDLRMYAALNAASKAIATMVDTLKESVNDQALEEFLNRQNAKSIKGADGDTNASLQLRRRTSRSFLSEQELATLTELNIATKKSADSKVYINPAYADNDEMADKVFAALEGVVPEDFLLSTGEKYVVGETAVDDALKIEDEDVRRSVVKIVSTQAARTKFGGSHDEMLEILDSVLKG